MIFLVLALLDPTVGLILAALIGVLATVLPGTFAFRRIKATAAKASDRENFQALVSSWATYAAEQEERATKLEARCGTLELELLKVKQELWKLHIESAASAQKYEATIAQLRATLQ